MYNVFAYSSPELLLSSDGHLSICLYLFAGQRLFLLLIRDLEHI